MPDDPQFKDGRSKRLVAFAAVTILMLVAAGFVIGRFRSTRQMELLKNHSNLAQLAIECVSFAEIASSNIVVFHADSPQMPPLLQSLSPKWIRAWSNQVQVEFGGRFNHYGYMLDRSKTEKNWTLKFYTEESTIPLIVVTND